MNIRQENSNDYEQVYNLVKKAFESAEHSDGNEHELVCALRKSQSFIPELTLVALTANKIVGHIMFSRATVDNEDILILAPLSVLPEFQNKGIGSALIKEGHKTACRLGYEYCAVLGSEKYYPRFGYVISSDYGIQPPKGIPTQNFMVVKLSAKAKNVNGYVKFAKEFGI